MILKAQIVIDVITDWFDLEKGQVIFGPNTRMTVKARHTIMYFLRLSGLSWQEIAAKLECDHSTAMLGASRIGVQRGKNKQIKADLIEIETMINEKQTQRQTQLTGSAEPNTTG